MIKLWSSFSAPTDITLDILFPKKEKFCYLVGSGISVDAPSNLPTGEKFTTLLLQHILPREELDAIRNLSNNQRVESLGSGDFLRFEELIQLIQESIDPNLHILDDFAYCKIPNFCHHFLAEMIIQSSPVFTTNFDNLLEYALENYTMNFEKIYPVIFREDWEDAPKEESYCIYKLHGSLVDFRTKNRNHDSLQTTLSAISQRKGDILSLEPWKRNVFQQYLKKYHLIVMGYSGLDDFDVLPTLFTINSDKKIIWITHDPNRVIEDVKIEIFKELDTEEPNDSTQNEKDDSIQYKLHNFFKNGTRKPDQIYRIFINTQILLKWLWNRKINLPLPELSESSHIISNNLNSLTIGNYERWYFAGKLNSRKHRFSESLKNYNKALKLAEETKNENYQALCLSDIAYALIQDNKYNNALEYAEKGLAKYIELNDNNGRRRCLNHIGLINQYQGDLFLALKNYKESFKIAININDSKGIFYSLSNIATVYFQQGKFNEALKNYSQAFSIADTIGDVVAKARISSNIGDLLRKQQKNKDAISYFEKALDISKLIGDLSLQSKILNNIASIYTDDDFEKAISLFGEAIEKASLANDKNSIATIYNNIGYIYLNQNKLDLAITKSQIALDIFNKIGNNHGKAVSNYTIGLAYYRQKNYKKSILYIENALCLAKPTEDVNLISSIKEDLQKLYDHNQSKEDVLGQ